MSRCLQTFTKDICEQPFGCSQRIFVSGSQWIFPEDIREQVIVDIPSVGSRQIGPQMFLPANWALAYRAPANWAPANRTPGKYQCGISGPRKLGPWKILVRQIEPWQIGLRKILGR